MPKRDRGSDNLPPDTSHNKYSAPEGGALNTRIKGILKHFITTHDDTINMPIPIFGSEEVGEMLNKATVTINKEARELGAGFMKGTTRLYTSEDVKRLYESFSQKRRLKVQKSNPLRESIAWTLFQRQEVLYEEYKKLHDDFQRLYVLVGEIFNKVMERLEKLERGG